MKREGFIEINKQRIERDEEPFANARNATAGIVRQLDSKKVADKPLEIFFYDILEDRENGFESHWDKLQKFPEWGLKTNLENIKCSSFDGIKKHYDDFLKKRGGLDYEIDGMVIKVDDFKLRKSLGTRQEAKEKIEILGGRATSSVSSNTDYLVVGENPGSKLDEAKKENVKIIKEKHFKHLLKTGKLR